VAESPPQTAAHGADIVALATTDDGLAVASADARDGIRLWPALDGTREPVVIRAPAPRALALTRDGDGFALGIIDAAGVVHLVQATAAGVVRGRAIAPGQAALELASTPEGLLILRSDQTLELVDGAGAVRSRLAPDPGTRIDSLVARVAGAGRVLALIAEDRRLHGRWIAIDRGARWGAATPPLPFPIGRAVVSPRGGRLAVTRPNGLPALIDLTKGTALSEPLCVTRSWLHDIGAERSRSAMLAGRNAPIPIGFLTEDVVACSVLEQLVWWNTDGTPHRGDPLPVGADRCTVLDRGAICGAEGSLALAAPQGVRFLGYGVPELSGLRAGGGGMLVGGSDQQHVMLGTGLAGRARFDATRDQRKTEFDIVAIDERYAIVSSLHRGDDRVPDGFQLAVFDGVADAVHQVLAVGGASDGRVAYEPASGLLVARDGGMPALVRYDPVSHAFGDPVRIGNAIAPSRLFVLDPRLSGGVVALQIDVLGDDLLIGELSGAELVPGAVIQSHASYVVPGELRAVDRAGHVYVHRRFDRDDLAVYGRGQQVAALRDVAAMQLRPSPDGAAIAAFAGPRMVLIAGTGEVRWDGAAWGALDLDWTAAGDLIAAFPSGAARIDRATGALAERRCGWSFGLTLRPPPPRRHRATSGSSICELPRD
jgi:hypothetical protein